MTNETVVSEDIFAQCSYAFTQIEKTDCIFSKFTKNLKSNIYFLWYDILIPNLIIFG